MSSDPKSFRHPPRLADWILARTLPPGPRGDSIRGDLTEEFQESRRLARTWFWIETLQLSARYSMSRLRRRRLRFGSTPSRLKEAFPMFNDLRQTFRSLRRSPGFWLASVLTIALGIGANTTIFSVVHTLFFQPLPYLEPDRLVVLWPQSALSQKVVAFLQEQSSTLSGVAGDASMSSPLIPPGGEPVELQGAGVTEGYFSILGTDPQLGRIFQREDHLPGAEPVVVLSDSTWRERFSADPATIGKTVRLGTASRTIVGVLPAGYLPFVGSWSFWIPLTADQASPVYSGRTWIRTKARLAPGVPLEQAQAEVTRLAALAVEAEPTIYDRDWVAQARLEPLQRWVVADLATAAGILQGAVFLVFLIACSNIANLLVSRGSARRREIAVRFALGANRWRVLRQLMTESLLLGLLGGLLGFLLAIWMSSWVRSLETGGIPLIERAQVGPQIALFTLLLSVLASLLFGLGPAWISSREDSRECLGQARQPSATGNPQSWRSLLVAAEVALAVVLVCGAGLMLSSLLHLSLVDPGFQPDQVVTMKLTPSRSAYPDGAALTLFFEDCLQRIRALPWVRQAGAIHMLPLASSGFFFTYVTREHPVPDNQPRPTASVRLVTPGYFESMGIPLLSGRTFQSSDRQDGRAVGLINASLARKLWPDQEAVGKQIHFFDFEEPPFEVIGVVGDVHQSRLDSTPDPEIYRPLTQYPWSSAHLTIRVQGSASGRIPELRRSIREIHGETTISDASTMPMVVRESFADSRLYTLLISLFGVLALGLGLIGVYGVMSCTVNQRTHEIGVRMALGARSANLTGTLLAWGMRRVSLGILLGLPAAAGAGRFLEGLLYGVEPLDPVVLAAVTLLVSGAACLAILLPARRATRIDPIQVLNSNF